MIRERLLRTLLSLALSLGACAPALAKKERPLPTPTPTQEPLSTPTPDVYRGQKPYTFDAKWGSRGTGPDRMDSPEDVDVFPDGRVVVADTANHRVLVFDADGRPLAAYGSFGTSATWRNAPQFNRPSGVLAHPSRKIYVADTYNHRVVVLDEKGLVVSSWGFQGPEKGQFNQPRAMARDREGNIRVLDSANSRLQIFSGLGEFISVWGEFGQEPGKLNLPLGFALNFIDQAVVADTGNFRIQVFNDLGAPVTHQGWYGEGPYQFKEPTGLAMTRTGLVAVTDGLLDRVQFLNNRFEFFGQWAAKDDIPDKGYDPRFRGAAFDAQDRLYLIDNANHCLVRLRPVNALTPTAANPTPTPLASDPFGGVGFPIR